VVGVSRPDRLDERARSRGALIGSARRRPANAPACARGDARHPLDSGELALARCVVDEYAEIADEIPCALWRFFAGVDRASLGICLGEFDAAEALLDGSRSRARLVPYADALVLRAALHAPRRAW